jgi:hypothetical protein
LGLPSKSVAGSFGAVFDPLLMTLEPGLSR